MSLDTSNWQSKFEVKRLNVQVTGNKAAAMRENRFARICLREKRIDLQQNQNQYDPQPIPNISLNISPSEMRNFFAIFVCLFSSENRLFV